MTATPATLHALRRVLDAGEISSGELVEAALARAEATRATLNAFIGLRPEPARAAAAGADARRARGEGRGPLDGLPIAIKDNMVQAGIFRSDECDRITDPSTA